MAEEVRQDRVEVGQVLRRPQIHTNKHFEFWVVGRRVVEHGVEHYPRLLAQRIADVDREAVEAHFCRVVHILFYVVLEYRPGLVLDEISL